MGQPRYTVAVTGPSTVFKTTVCEKLEARGVGVRLRGDGFYGHRPAPQGMFGMRDFESPLAVDLEGLAETVKALREGADAVLLPEYDREQHCRTDRLVEFRPASRVILLDSLFALNDPVFETIDFGVALDIPDDLVRTRRRERQGADYTDDYHRYVMVPSLHAARGLWQIRANQYIPLREDTTSDQLADYLQAFLSKKIAA